MDATYHPQKASHIPWYRRISWPVTLFLVGVPVVALVWTPIHIYLNGLEWGVFAFFLLYAAITMMSITAGYHRLFSHRSYQAKSWVKFLYLFFGAGAFQASALKWASDHRRHHRFEDTESDPYNIRRGFFFAHFGWMLLKDDPKYAGVYEKDLMADPLVAWQHKYYLPLAFFSGFVFPTLVCWLWGSPLGGLVIAGFLRICVSQHLTFLINSIAHMVGKKTYSEKLTARDNVVLAIFTYGEGYHNFHHRFASDYRNGIRWFHWDPTKWLINGLRLFGGTKNLHRVPDSEILRARLQQDSKQLAARGAPTETITKLREKVESAQKSLRSLKVEYRRLKKNMQDQSREQLLQLKAEYRLAKLEFKMAFRQWCAYRNTLLALPVRAR